MFKTVIASAAPLIIKSLRESGALLEIAKDVVDLIADRTEDERAYVNSISKRLVDKVKTSNYYIVVKALLGTLSEESELVRKVLEAVVDASDEDGFTMEDASKLILDLAEQFVPAEIYNKLADTIYSLRD
jgi:hypothetical protein